jgi:hypothetical protein
MNYPEEDPPSVGWAVAVVLFIVFAITVILWVQA